MGGSRKGARTTRFFSRAYPPEQLVEHDAAGGGYIQRSFRACHGNAHARVAPRDNLRGQSLDLMAECHEHRKPGLPLEEIDRAFNGLYRNGLPTGTLTLVKERQRLYPIPRHALLGTKRGFRDLLRRRSSGEPRQVKARQPDSICGSKERADVVQAADVVEKNFDGQSTQISYRTRR